VLQQSYDKRYTPSTFIEETDSGYRVGWYDHGHKHLQHFTDFFEAARRLLAVFVRQREIAMPNYLTNRWSRQEKPETLGLRRIS
jgi:hypothetical protein